MAPFCEPFVEYNEKVIMEFIETLNYASMSIHELNVHVPEASIALVTSLAQTNNRWFKDRAWYKILGSNSSKLMHQFLTRVWEFINHQSSTHGKRYFS